MMGKKKKLSNPFSTGGGGSHFEAHVQASFSHFSISTTVSYVGLAKSY
ncbi:hypothetical protein [Legionella cherrii]|nr:hypothetical protein [Legionella cherrii]